MPGDQRLLGDSMKSRLLLVFALLAFASFARAEAKFTYQSNHYTVELFDEADQQVIVFNGYIMPLDTDKGLRDVVKQLIPGKNTTLAIGTSNGGENRVFSNFGKALQKVCPAEGCRLTTYVKSYCISACTTLYLYGRERLASAYALFGFHRTYIGAIGINITVQSKKSMANEFLQFGVDPDWVAKNIKNLSSNQKHCVFATGEQLVAGSFVHRVAWNFTAPGAGLLYQPSYPGLPSGGTAFVPAI